MKTDSIETVQPVLVTFVDGYGETLVFLKREALKKNQVAGVTGLTNGLLAIFRQTAFFLLNQSSLRSSSFGGH